MGIERSKTKLDYWKNKDPLKKIEEFLLKKNIFSRSEINLFKCQMKEKVLNSWKKALNFKDQTKSDLFKFVYHD